MKMRNILWLVLTIALVRPTAAMAGYVWNGVDGTAYDYAGTNNPPWNEDSGRTGKWIINGADALTQSSTTIANNEDLTVEGAAYSVTENLVVNSSLTINDGGVVNAQKGLWMGKGNYTPTITILTGGTLNVSGNTSYLSDNKAASSTIDVNGGTLAVATQDFKTGHHGAIDLKVRNGGEDEHARRYFECRSE